MYLIYVIFHQILHSALSLSVFISLEWSINLPKLTSERNKLTVISAEFTCVILDSKKCKIWSHRCKLDNINCSSSQCHCFNARLCNALYTISSQVFAFHECTLLYRRRNIQIFWRWEGITST